MYCLHCMIGSLAYLAKKQLIIALEKRNMREGQKNENKVETEVTTSNNPTKISDKSHAATDLDKLLKVI